MRKQNRTPSVYSADDPLAAALKVDPNETPMERELRLQAENAAKSTSERIDEELRQERERLKRSKGDVKVSRFYLLSLFQSDK